MTETQTEAEFAIGHFITLEVQSPSPMECNTYQALITEVDPACPGCFIVKICEPRISSMGPDAWHQYLSEQPRFSGVFFDEGLQRWVCGALAHARREKR